MIVLGVMSGTSLDGLDLALCHFTEEYNNMQHELLQSATLPYNAEWIKRLSRAHQLTGRELVILNHEYGQFIGAAINNFIREGKIKPSLIASHGHTIFHEPDSGFTFQAGLGANIAAVTGLPCVSDFRILDVALGGQGAPLVPAGEIALYPGYDAYINLGGFANITIKTEDKVLAFDISPCNYALNHAARKMNHSCDEGGEIARKGNISTQLLDALNNLEFYNQEPPKSLGREWFERNFKVLLETGTTNNTDLLRTLCEHVAMQVSRVLLKYQVQKVLVTGGGAYNSFLINLLKNKIRGTLVIPGKETIEYKEAIIFAYLGMLRYQNKVNCLKSVTGARMDNSGGTIFNI